MAQSRVPLVILWSAWLGGSPLFTLLAANEKDPPKPQAETQLPREQKVNGGVLPGSYAGLPLLWIPKRKAPAKLTGDLNDAAWKEAAPFSMLGIVKKEPPKHKTDGFIFCTDDSLYVGFRCHDDNPDKLMVDGNAIWKNDGVEIFIEPAGDTLKKPYHQIIVDAKGNTAFHRHHIYPLHGSIAIREAWTPSLESLTGRGEKCWTCEIRIPFNQLKMGEAARNKKSLWRLNLFRTRPERGEEPLMESGWSPPGNDRYHCASKFGYALPEVYSTKDLLEEVRRTAALPAPPEVMALAPEQEPVLRYEARKRIGELGSEIYLEREEAATRLKTMASRSAASVKALLEELEEALAKYRDQETLLEVKRISEQVKKIQIIKDDDDPPPENLLPATAQVEAGN